MTQRRRQKDTKTGKTNFEGEEAEPLKLSAEGKFTKHILF